MTRTTTFALVALLGFTAAIVGSATGFAQAFPPVGGGGTCTGMINPDGYQGQQSAVNNGLYSCVAGTYEEQALIIGMTAAACNATWSGGIRYNSTSGGRIEFCNGSAWTNVGTGGGSIDGLLDGKTDYATGDNFWLGQNAGNAIASGGIENLAIGEDAGAAITTGDYNIAVGISALGSLTTGSYNVAIGPGSLFSNVTGTSNIAIGFTALTANTGTGNVAVGDVAMDANTSGNSNTAIGMQALSSNTTGNGNVALGMQALVDTTIGVNNVATGSQALSTNVAGSGSTAVGDQAMFYANSSAGAFTTFNTAIGFRALYGSTTPASNTGISNTALGYASLQNVTSGSSNIAIGDRAADNLTTGSTNITIGSNIDAVSATGNNQLNIGNTVYGDLSTDSLTIGTTAGQIRALPAGAQTIAATNIIAADACGTVKQITSAGAVTTSTTNTFTAPAAANAGCCMDVVNTGTNSITLDANTNFRTAGGADQVLGTQYDSLRVCSNGTYWFQMGAIAGNQ